MEREESTRYGLTLAIDQCVII